MCAIFGWFKPQFPRGVNRERLLKQLARKCQAWGDKSFGLAAKLEDGMSIAKYAGPASEWLAQNDKALKKWAASDVVLGHTRQPTQGAVNKINAHPFQIGGWITAHNGCIRNSAHLMAKAVYVAKGETDSEEALCYIVTHDFGKEALEEISGSYAFEAIKKDGSEAVLAVDSTANLHIVNVGTGLVWCTSSEVLQSSLYAAGMTVDPPTRLENTVLRMPSLQTVELNTRFRWSSGMETAHGKEAIKYTSPNTSESISTRYREYLGEGKPWWETEQDELSAVDKDMPPLEEKQ